MENTPKSEKEVEKTPTLYEQILFHNKNMTFSIEEKQFSKIKNEKTSMLPLQMKNSETLKTEKPKKNNYNEKEFTNNHMIERKSSLPIKNLEECKNNSSYIP